MAYWHGSLLLLSCPVLLVNVQPTAATANASLPRGRDKIAERQTQDTSASVSSAAQSVHMPSVVRSENQDVRLLKGASETSRQTAEVPPFVCADEGQTCQCTGTVVYCRKFMRGMPGWGQMASPTEVVRSRERISKQVDNGYITCDNDAFGKDPAPKAFKYCMCFAGNSTPYEDSLAPSPAGYDLRDIWPYMLRTAPGEKSLLRTEASSRVMRSEVEHVVSSTAHHQEVERFQPYMCAEEGQVCECTGTVVYGQKFTGGSNKKSLITSASEVLANYHVSVMTASGVRCSPQAFGEDPALGSDKHCYCFKGDTPVAAGTGQDNGAPSTDGSDAESSEPDEMDIPEGQVTPESVLQKPVSADVHASRHRIQKHNAKSGSMSASGDIVRRLSTPHDISTISLTRDSSRPRVSHGAHGNSSAEPIPFVCADEGQICSCSGTAVYGRKFVSRFTDSGQMTNAVEIVGNVHRSVVDQYHTNCTVEAFPPPDPAPGLAKYCYCFEGDSFQDQTPTTTTRRFWGGDFGR